MEADKLTKSVYALYNSMETRTGIFPNGWVKKSIEQVKQYNTKKKAQYQKDIDQWDSNKGGFPYMGFYIYTKPKTNDEYQRGIVVSWEHCEGGKGSQLFHTKQQAKDFFFSDKV